VEKQIDILLQHAANHTLRFTDVIALIDTHYRHQPTAFRNGDAYNEATQNQGSAKLFSFARLQGLSVADTLNLFAEHYQSVLASPDGNDHQNIRQFMKHGWGGIVFEGDAIIADQATNKS
jgi:hypothetical protein